MKECRQLELYLKLFPEVKREDVENTLSMQIKEAYDKNTLGFRIINTLINQYFIKGPTPNHEAVKVTFRKTLSFD